MCDISPSSLFNLLKFSVLPLLLDFRPRASFSRTRLMDAIHMDATSLIAMDQPDITTSIHKFEDLHLDGLSKMISTSTEWRRIQSRLGSDVIIVMHEDVDSTDSRLVNVIRRIVDLLISENIVKSIRILYEHEKFHQDFSFLCVQSYGGMIHPIYPTRRVTLYPSEIMPGFLYLGSQPEVSTMDALVDLGIEYVLNTAAQCGDKNKGMFVYAKLDLLDRKDADIAKHFETAFEFINTAKRLNVGVVVHCQVGVSRSATIVIAYLMKEMGWDLKTAFAHVKRCRPIIRPNKGFLQSLEDYDEFLKEQSRSKIKEIQ